MDCIYYNCIRYSQYNIKNNLWAYLSKMYFSIFCNLNRKHIIYIILFDWYNDQFIKSLISIIKPLVFNKGMQFGTI